MILKNLTSSLGLYITEKKSMFKLIGKDLP